MTSPLSPVDSLLGLGFPEALRWREGELWFSDMFRSRVVRWSPGRSAECVVDEAGGGPRMPGGLGWLPDGRLLVVDCLARRLLRKEEDGRLVVHADLSTFTEHPLNDMHVDSDGTAWVGGYGFDPDRDEPVASPLLRVEADGSASMTSARFVFPNGCERRRDGLVVAETFADRLSLLDDRGGAASLLSLPPRSGPDGLSLGSDDSVWVALAFAGELAHVERDGTTRRWPVPGDRGDDGRERGVFDCAVSPDGFLLAVATADADEAHAMRHDTGAIRLLEIA